MYLTKEFSLTRKRLNERQDSGMIQTKVIPREVVVIERSLVPMSKYSFTLEEGIHQLKGFIEYHSYRFGLISRLNDKPDFESIAHAVIWKGIQRYKPECPVCKKKFISMERYNRHSHFQGLVSLPTYNLESYVRLRILSAFQSEIKKEVAQKRNPKDGVGPLESEPPVNHNEFGSAELYDFIHYSIREFTSVERTIVQMVVDRYDTTDIILLLEPHGINVNFVRRTIQKFRTHLKCYYNLKKKSEQVA